jgi:Domain of unknown function (DUF4160)
MPTLYATANWKITMYFRDYGPPHFHVMTKDRREAQVRLADLAVMAGEVPKPILNAALKWATANRPRLLAKWRDLHPA